MSFRHNGVVIVVIRCRCFCRQRMNIYWFWRVRWPVIFDYQNSSSTNNSFDWMPSSGRWCRRLQWLSCNNAMQNTNESYSHTHSSIRFFLFFLATLRLDGLRADDRLFAVVSHLIKQSFNASADGIIIIMTWSCHVHSILRCHHISIMRELIDTLVGFTHGNRESDDGSE